jgi:hypothetical protein
MSNRKISPITKTFFIFSILILFLWVVPTAISYYKNKNIYTQKIIELEKLDSREIPLDAKPFHTEVFKTDAKNYFNSVNIVSIPNNEYSVTISFHIDKLPKFYDFLKNISLNYKIALEDTIKYKESNSTVTVNMIVKPY